MRNWQVLQGVTITEELDGDIWQAKKSFSADVLAAAESRNFDIAGFYVPIQAQAYIEFFLLVPDPADCPFCGNGGYGPSLEVTLKKPMKDMAEFSKLHIRGQLELIDDPTTYQAYRMIDAAVVAAN
ncbi:hypothetical protein AIOL_002786 [Candidatus Rhodobacter oscarellae]|uniref:Uncharacterized protein n=1 Tax=Candidatus Rhodobacter oscarellae TaxID=1675527 RepID=A0A0J9GW86_9RHOB|nr:hypothetical protein [Candidatus Rhodobacter lobularis]KMW57818.1 hypothetical protein AIOL_002786 [Candidatus Rhodobacter lobularis]